MAIVRRAPQSSCATGNHEHSRGQKRNRCLITAEYPAAQKQLKLRILHHVHRSRDMNGVFDVESSLTKLAHNLCARIDARARPAVVQWFGKPAEEWNPVPLQKGKGRTMGFKYPPAVGNRHRQASAGLEH